LSITKFIGSSLSLTISSYAGEIIRLDAGRSFAFVPKASYPIVANDARFGRIGLGEQSVMSNSITANQATFVSHQVKRPPPKAVALRCSHLEGAFAPRLVSPTILFLSAWLVRVTIKITRVRVKIYLFATLKRYILFFLLFRLTAL
jgi:hypothetical protein